MAKIILKNTGKPPRRFEESEQHGIVCRRRQECTCATFALPPVRKGQKARTMHNPRSFSINVGASVEVDEEVLYIPRVWDALQSGWLKRVDVQGQEG